MYYIIVTQIVTSQEDGSFCIKPKEGGCEPKDGTWLTLQKDCSGKDALYTYDVNKGRLVHKCSGKKVCRAGGKGSNPVFCKLIVSNACPDPTPEQRIVRTFSKLLFN